MFSVIFEVQPKPQEWEAYLAEAARLRPELEQVDGFIDNVRYKSLNREGWILSVSDWRDEKSVVRWRTRHHEVQVKGRNQILQDYHLRVGQITQDTRLPEGFQLIEQRLDETEVGEGKVITLIAARRPEQWPETNNPDDCAEFLGLNPYADGVLSYEVFEAVLSPGDLVLLCAWRDNAAAEAFEAGDPARWASAPDTGYPGLRYVRPSRGPAVLSRRRAIRAMSAMDARDMAGAKKERSLRLHGHRLP
jgi:heme-degrading monooxygenase HmoA